MSKTQTISDIRASIERSAQRSAHADAQRNAERLQRAQTYRAATPTSPWVRLAQSSTLPAKEVSR